MTSAALALAVLLGQDRPAPLAPVEKVEVGKNREILVNGKPFFPILSWAQSARRFERLRALGFNTFCGGRGKESCDAARQAGGYALPHFAEGVKGHPALLAYLQPDEPDLGFDKGRPRTSPEAVVEQYRKIRAADDTRPVFQNLTSAFMESGPGAERRTAAERKAYYEAVVRGADLLGFDIYPIYGWNRDDRLIWVAEGVTDLARYAGPSRPVFAFIETSKGSRWIDADRQKDVRPEHTRAEVWMAILRGATGIAYFTHAWRPEFTEFRPDEEMQRELKRLNEQITRLAPVLLSGPARAKVSIAFEGGLAGEAAAREHEGSLYLFANNLDMKGRGGKATLSVEGLRSGSRIEVIDEARTLVADEGRFTDDFAPLAVHLYRVAR
jgi:hypothetical protein